MHQPSPPGRHRRGGRDPLLCRHRDEKGGPPAHRCGQRAPVSPDLHARGTDESALQRSDLRGHGADLPRPDGQHKPGQRASGAGCRPCTAPTDRGQHAAPPGGQAACLRRAHGPIPPRAQRGGLAPFPGSGRQGAAERGRVSRLRFMGMV